MDNPARIIGLAGTNGSGKDTVGQILASHHGFLFVSVSEFLRDEARQRKLPITREVLRTISAEWRREFGLGVLVDKSIELFNASPGKYKGVVVSPMRNPGEADYLKSLGGTLVWVDADPRVRYDRVQANAASRQRKGEDNKTFEQFQSEEAAEMNKPADGDDATLNMSAVKQRRDVFIDNAGNDLSGLQDSIIKSLDL